MKHKRIGQIESVAEFLGRFAKERPHKRQNLLFLAFPHSPSPEDGKGWGLSPSRQIPAADRHAAGSSAPPGLPSRFSRLFKRRQTIFSGRTAVAMPPISVMPVRASMSRKSGFNSSRIRSFRSKKKLMPDRRGHRGTHAS